MIAQRTLPNPNFDRIGLLVLNESYWSRSILHGIARGAESRSNLDFWFAPCHPKKLSAMPADWQGDGVIARVANSEIRDSIEALNLPAVNVSWHGNHTSRIPKVITDPSACGTTVADYYVERGYSMVAYVGPPACYQYNDPVLPSVRTVADREGISLQCFEADPQSESSDYDYQRRRLLTWLKDLPKPVGLVAWSSRIAREVIVSCESIHIDVPNDVAVVAIEHDPIQAALSPLPISHVQQRIETVGYRALEELLRLIGGSHVKETPVLVAPEGIVEKASTDSIFCDDDIVHEAVHFIQMNATKTISVEDVLKKVDVSRRALEMRFKRSLNRTPAEVIRNVRLEAIKKLLRETDLSLTAISYRTGFSAQNTMLQFFKRVTGQTPGEYRKNYQLAAISKYE